MQRETFVSPHTQETRGNEVHKAEFLHASLQKVSLLSFTWLLVQPSVALNHPRLLPLLQRPQIPIYASYCSYLQNT